MIFQVKAQYSEPRDGYCGSFNGELLSLSDKKRNKFVNKLNPFLSQRDADLASSDIAERNQIINDLKNNESIVNLQLQILREIMRLTLSIIRYHLI